MPLWCLFSVPLLALEGGSEECRSSAVPLDLQTRFSDAAAFDFAVARALMTTKAKAVLSVHSSSLVNNFVPVTKAE